MLNLPNIDYVIGDSIPLRVGFFDEDTLAYHDLTGAQDAWFTLKQLPTDSDAAALITKRMAGGISIADPTGGLIDIFPNVAETEGLVGDFEYFCDARVKTAGGFIASVRFTVTARRQATLSAA